jgi:hypothetical protein
MAEWVLVPDPEGSGDSYYWNRKTGETTWDPPEGMEQPAVSLEEASAGECPMSCAAGRSRCAAVTLAVLLALASRGTHYDFHCRLHSRRT